MSDTELSALESQISSVRNGVTNGTVLPGFFIDDKPAGRLIIVAITPRSLPAMDTDIFANQLLEEWEDRTCNDEVEPVCANSLVMVVGLAPRSVGIAISGDVNVMAATEDSLDAVKRSTIMRLDTWDDRSIGETLSLAVHELSVITSPESTDTGRMNAGRRSTGISPIVEMLYIWFYMTFIRAPVTSSRSAGTRRVRNTG